MLVFSVLYLFTRYGHIRSIDIKRPHRPPAFAFVAFEDHRDAEDAVRGRDGTTFDGQRIRCEFSKARDGGGGGGDRRDGGGRFGGGDRRGPPTRSNYGVIVTNLPRGCSWQDLKDFMRKAGSVCYADVDRDRGDGVVEFQNEDDMDYAIR